MGAALTRNQLRLQGRIILGLAVPDQAARIACSL
jgi:hypothetical protein